MTSHLNKDRHMDHNDTLEALSKTTTAVNGVLLGDIKKKPFTETLRLNNVFLCIILYQYNDCIVK